MNTSELRAERFRQGVKRQIIFCFSKNNLKLQTVTCNFMKKLLKNWENCTNNLVI